MRKIADLATTTRDLTDAMNERRAVTIAYTNQAGTDSRRTIEIAEITTSGAGNVTIRAWDRSVSQRRTFRADRISGYVLHRAARVADYREPVVAPEVATPAPERTEVAPVVVRPGDEVVTASGLVGRVQGKPLSAEWGVLAVVKFVAAEQPVAQATPAAKRCECSEFATTRDGKPVTTGCTATTKSKFAPGHDARLKGFLIRAGRDGLLVTRGGTDTREATDHAAGYGFAAQVLMAVARSAR